jgi:hypothetical protein
MPHSLASTGALAIVTAAVEAADRLDAAIRARPDAGDTPVIIAATSVRELRAELAGKRVDTEAMGELWRRASAAGAARVATLEAENERLRAELAEMRENARPRPRLRSVGG